MTATRVDLDPRRWRALALVCVAMFMTVLDLSIVNVALPAIKDALGASDKDLQWVVTAYAITIAGFLLLGGRIADLVGRRRTFMIGLAVFTGASLACGLSPSIGVLIAARAVEGIGGAILTPATLSIITTTFPDGHERNKALGIWGAVGAVGAAAGVLLGGVVTSYAGWRWVFFINVPVGAALLAATPRLIRESKVHGLRGFDVGGALTVTTALAALIWAISGTSGSVWSGEGLAGLLLSAVAFASFIVLESRQATPMVPFGIFRLGAVGGANVVAFFLGGVVFANFFLLALYVQDVLGFTPLKTGVTFLATSLTVVPMSTIAQHLATRIGATRVMTVGLAVLTLSMLWLAQLGADEHFIPKLFVIYILTGAGIALSYIPMSIAGLAGIPHNDAGLASGLINASRQVGGAVGVAVASSVVFLHGSSAVMNGSGQESAANAFSHGFWVIAAFGTLALIASVTLIRWRVPGIEPPPASSNG